MLPEALPYGADGSTVSTVHGGHLMNTPAANVTLVIEGTPDPLATPVLAPELVALVGVPRVAAGYQMLTPVRGEAAAEVRVEAREDDLVELHLEGGLNLLMSVADYRARFAEKAGRGTEAKGEVRVKAMLPAKGRDRGILTWIVKGLKVIGIDLAEKAAQKLADHVDTKKGLNGLYGCPLDSDALALDPQPRFAPGSEPLLVFIHGTMSSTEGSFGGLWSDRRDVRLRLAQRYRERCYAFEHKTFTESPISNALALVIALPEGATLHLVSHSRGGLIGELICRASRIDDQGATLPSFDELDFQLLAAQEAARKDLRELGEVLKKKRLVVERFVRVACPARGTTMASRRLDRYLSVLRMGLSPLIELDWVKDIAWFVAAVVKERTDPGVMPGLEAMMPESATVKMLNRKDVIVDSDLRVIAGDYDGDGVLGTVADWAFEGFFGSENDVVVNTPSMYGGAARRTGNREESGWYFYAQGSQVYHFSYFKEPATAGQLANGLLQKDAGNAGFLPVSQAPHSKDPIARGIAVDLIKEEFGAPLVQKEPSRGGNKPLLVLVPGIMGSHLKVGEERIWLSAGEIAEGDFAKLREEAGGVATDGVFKMSYQALGNFLSSSHEVLYYPYDWRLSLQKKGMEFADYMARVLAASRGRAVRIVAHSMGGLLVRMAAVLSSAERSGNGWWERFRGVSGNRLIMAGTPNNGSWTVPYVLTGRDAVIGMLSALDLRHRKEEILKIVSGFEGLLEMLPPGAPDDCFSAATWAKWVAADGNSWPAPDPAILAKCRENRQLLEEFDFGREKEVLRYIAGCADSTPNGVAVRDDRLVFGSSRDGDGRVLWETGIPPGIKTWYVEAKHGDLLKHEKSFNAYLDLITRGETTQLPTADPRVRGAEPKTGEMIDRPIPFFPDQAMLLRAAVGGEILPQRQRERERGLTCFRVTVCHGDLRAARYPVAVGHYIGDSINGTEATLDRHLSGLLSQRHKLGVYPGVPGSADIFVAEVEGKASCAIVIGLGHVGDLTPADLTTGFTAAILKLATSPVLGTAVAVDGGGFAVSCILIGSGAGWGLSVRDCIRALIDGACRANALLAGLDGAPVHLAELELLEVFEDRALLALRNVRELAALGALGEIGYSNELRAGLGGRSRVMIEDRGDWWQRIKIQVNEEDEMTFSSLTGLARVEESIQPTQRALVDRLVEQAVQESAVSQDAMVAIYNLLTPNAVKKRAPDQGDILIMLDEKAAQYPWEMMHVAVGEEKIPLALRFGMVRQLSVKEFRPSPARAYRGRALVIADPKLSSNSSFPELPGARREGATVAKVLDGHGYQVTSPMSPDALQVVSSLFATDYRILHLAGHGIYNHPVIRTSATCGATARPITGMVLDWPEAGAALGKEPVLLTAVEVEQMGVVPELVFINCCFLGTIGITRENRNRFAASLAAQFIRMGVRAVVAAGWAVNDEAAESFAEKFYSALLGGASFGEAVTAARKAARDAAPEHNTWAAYQCYGDPSFRLEGDNFQPEGRFYLTPREAIYDLQAIHTMSRGDSSDTAAILRELQQVAGAIPHEWANRYGEIRAALARVYADALKFRRAIEEYEAAAKCPDGGCTVRDLDQLADLKARQAERKVSRREWTPEQGRGVIEQVIKQLEARSAELGETPDRSRITGNAYKLLLVIGTYSKTRTSAILESIATWYGKAAATPQPDPHPILNAISLRIIAESRKAGIQAAQLTLIHEELNEAEAAGVALYRQDPSFRNGVHEPNSDLYRIVLDSIAGVDDAAATTGRLNQLYNRYLKLAHDFGSTWMLDPVAKQVRFMTCYLGEKGDVLRTELEKLAQRLENATR
jgi:CHAT domain-containing protein